MPKFKPGQSGNPKGLPKKTPPRGAPKHLRQLAAAGWLESDMAREVCGVSAPTFIRMKKEHPELAEAIEAGRGDLHNMLFTVLKNSAAKGNFVPAMFLLKAKFGYRDQGDPPGEVRPQITINLPGALPADSLAGMSVDALRVIAARPLPSSEEDDGA